MTEINGIYPGQNYNVDLSALLSDKSTEEKDQFSKILSSLMAPPPPPPPPQNQNGPMDTEKLKKLSELISSSTSMSDSEKEEILALIEEMASYIEENDLGAIFTSMQPRRELTDEPRFH